MLLYKYVDRAGWGADTSLPRLGWATAPGFRNECYIHHTVGVDNDATPNVFENEAEAFRWMRRLQTIRPDLGKDVPYNFVGFFMSVPGVGEYVLICEGRGAHRSGAHTHGHNTSAIAIGLHGNFMLPTFGLEKFLPVLGVFLADLRDGGIPEERPSLPNLGAVSPPNRDVFGHRDSGAQTACPGNHVYNNLHLVVLDPEEEDAMPTIDEIRDAVRDVIREETDSKRMIVRLKGLPHVYHLDRAQGRLVHDVNLTAFLASGGDFQDLVTLDWNNPDHAEIGRLAILYPSGLRDLQAQFKPEG